MKYERIVLVLLPVLAVLALTACGSSEPGEDVVTELLNQRDAVEGEYTFHNVNYYRLSVDSLALTRTLKGT